jgi:hypothetical protein
MRPVWQSSPAEPVRLPLSLPPKPKKKTSPAENRHGESQKLSHEVTGTSTTIYTQYTLILGTECSTESTTQY